MSQGLLIASGEVLLTIILLTLVGFMLTHHISSLMTGTREMAGGNYSIKLKIPGADEIGRLAADFNLKNPANPSGRFFPVSSPKFRFVIMKKRTGKYFLLR